MVQLRTANAWQNITDPATVNVTNLAIDDSVQRTVDLWDQCPCIMEASCQEGQFKNPNPATAAKGIYYDNRPRMVIRQVLLTINGASLDGSVTRQISELVRVRNDDIEGTCPAV